jgi:hypothetical protein
MEQSESECTRRGKNLFPSSRAMAGDKGLGTSAHGRDGVNHGRDHTMGGGNTVVLARVRSVHVSGCGLAGGVGLVQAGVGSAHDILFPISNHFPIFSNDFFSNNQCCSNLGKHKINPSLSPQIAKLCMVVDKWKRNNFPFGTNFKIKTDFELQIQEETGFEIWLGF